MSGMRGVVILRAVARVWSAASALGLALFLIEHLEWFKDPHALPPARIFAAEGFHLLLILALLAAWRWELWGGLLAIAAAVGFDVTAGGGGRFVAVIGVATFPAALFIVASWWGWRAGRTANPAAAPTTRVQ